MNRIRLASILCITLGMLILTARFGTQRANLATPPSTFEATTIAVLARSTAQARIFASPTPAASPMATPQPTTPPQPTHTPPPTATPSNTPLPASSTDQDISDYYAQLSPALEAITNNLNTLKQLAQYPQPDDATWQRSVRTAIDAITTSRTTIVALQPPPTLDALHADVVDAANNCGEAMERLDAAMKTSDDADLLGAATLAQSCATKVQHVQEQITR